MHLVAGASAGTALHRDLHAPTVRRLWQRRAQLCLAKSGTVLEQCIGAKKGSDREAFVPR